MSNQKHHQEKHDLLQDQVVTRKASKTDLVAIAAAAVMAMAATSAVQAVPDQPIEWEKCGGVSKAGHNDCGSTDGKHKCHGGAKADDLKTEWIYVPGGTCEKLTGGKVIAKKPAKKG